MASLNFDGCNTLYATHGLHAYAAKCPPQLVRYGLRYYSKVGETVLDPMAGSGTTLVEARLTGRNAIGYDIDPLARLIAEVKSRVIKDKLIVAAQDELIRRTECYYKVAQRLPTVVGLPNRIQLPDLPRRDYWFSRDVTIALALLSHYINETPMAEAIRNFFWVAFSSLILAKSSVANARDIVHSRHHYWEHERPPDVLSKFKSRVKAMRRQMQEFAELCEQAPAATAEARLGDARKTRQPAESVDLIFSSPPYVTALDYPRAHFLAVAWMQKVLDFNAPDYMERGKTYIGTERACPAGEFGVDERLSSLSQTHKVLESLAHSSRTHAKRTQRYFLDMLQVFGEMRRVLKQGRHAIIVVCPSHIRKVEIPTHDILVELARRHGLRLKQEYTRTISARRRVLPYMQESFGKRMSTEYVLIFQKR